MIHGVKLRFPPGFAVGMSLILISCAISPVRAATEHDLQLNRATALLAKNFDADSLAAAGLLSILSDRDSALTLVARSVAAEPERADLTLLQAGICREVATCDPAPIERRLRELDPSNGAGWMGALVRASLSKDQEARDAALAAIGHTDHVDIYWTRLIARLSRAIERTKTVSLPESENSVIGLLAAVVIPAYSAAINGCKGNQLQRAEILEVCRGVARALQRGDTDITEMIGVAIAKRAWPENSPEWKAASEARRAFEYRSKFSSALDVLNTSHANEYLTLCANNRREQDVSRAQLIAIGQNPDPPPE